MKVIEGKKIVKALKKIITRQIKKSNKNLNDEEKSD